MAATPSQLTDLSSIKFDTNIMLLQTLSYFEHDLIHDLHPKAQGRDRWLQAFNYNFNVNDILTIDRIMTSVSTIYIHNMLSTIYVYCSCPQCVPHNIFLVVHNISFTLCCGYILWITVCCNPKYSNDHISVKFMIHHIG